MEKLNVFIGVLVSLFLLSCEGPQGPPGLDGRDGNDGEDALGATVFEQSVSFTYDLTNNLWFSDEFTFTDTLDGDVFLAYVHVGNNLFTPLPASFFDDQGEYQYVFDHNVDSVQFQIIGDNDLGNLDQSVTNNIITRIAILPAELVAQSDITSGLDMGSLMSQMNLNESDIVIQRP